MIIWLVMKPVILRLIILHLDYRPCSNPELAMIVLYHLPKYPSSSLDLTTSRRLPPIRPPFVPVDLPNNPSTRTLLFLCSSFVVCEEWFTATKGGKMKSRCSREIAHFWWVCSDFVGSGVGLPANTEAHWAGWFCPYFSAAYLIPSAAVADLGPGWCVVLFRPSWWQVYGFFWMELNKKWKRTTMERGRSYNSFYNEGRRQVRGLCEDETTGVLRAFHLNTRGC